MLKEANLKYGNLVCQCQYLMNRLGKTLLEHVFRGQNQVADILAKEGVMK